MCVCLGALSAWVGHLVRWMFRLLESCLCVDASAASVLLECTARLTPVCRVGGHVKDAWCSRNLRSERDTH
ncbi:hypothetical protein BKA81DRAFT_345075 [Phyllosticta paracitricarpa]